MNQTVLYIEDNLDNIRLVERLFTRRPQAELLVSRSAREGVEIATRERPALILLDNRLPDASGRDVLGQLAADQGTAGIPVIVISGDTGGQTAADLIAIGAAEFLPKPFDLREFLAAVDRYLS
jgi:CheY-like chemotaxis protein